VSAQFVCHPIPPWWRAECRYSSMTATWPPRASCPATTSPACRSGRLRDREGRWEWPRRDVERRLSAGARDQIYLAIRFALAAYFSPPVRSASTRAAEQAAGAPKHQASPLSCPFSGA